MPHAPAPKADYPQVGMLATVRNRRAIITSVDRSGPNTGDAELSLVRLEYLDLDGVPDETL